MIDNKSIISLARNPVPHGRNKHIERKCHFISEQVMKGVIEVIYFPTKEQLDDGITKALKVESFEYLRSKLGFIDI